MEQSGGLQKERQQAWLEIAGDSYRSSFEFSGFELMDKQEESTSGSGSLRRGRHAEKKSDQHPAQSEDIRLQGAARSNPHKIKSDENQRVKREGKNPFISLHRDRSPSRSRRPSSVPRSDKSPSQTRGNNDVYRASSSHSPDLRDFGPRSRVCNASHGSDSELTDGQVGSPRKSVRAIKRFVEGVPKSTENKAPAGFEILLRQKSEHLQLDDQTQPTSQGVIKDPDSLGGGGRGIKQ